MKLHTVISSVRPTRIGPTIARWFNDYAVKHGKFDAELIDLVDFKLPVHDEPEHPRMGNYAHEHTKAWSKSVAPPNVAMIARLSHSCNRMSGSKPSISLNASSAFTAPGRATPRPPRLPEE